MQIKSQERIGVLGGTFNPIHLGHLLLAQQALERCELNNVIFIPCSCPPHKSTAMLAPARHRLAMTRQALAHDLCFEASDMEVSRGGVSYAVDTVTELRKQHADAEVFFIIGSDSLKELYLWRNIESLLPLCHFVTFARPGHDVETITPESLHLQSPWPERLLENVVTGRLIDISSSDIRHRVAEGMAIRYLVPGPVEMYIAEHGLYGSR